MGGNYHLNFGISVTLMSVTNNVHDLRLCHELDLFNDNGSKGNEYWLYKMIIFLSKLDQTSLD